MTRPLTDFTDDLALHRATDLRMRIMDCANRAVASGIDPMSVANFLLAAGHEVAALATLPPKKVVARDINWNTPSSPESPRCTTCCDTGRIKVMRDDREISELCPAPRCDTREKFLASFDDVFNGSPEPAEPAGRSEPVPSDAPFDKHFVVKLASLSADGRRRVKNILDMLAERVPPRRGPG